MSQGSSAELPRNFGFLLINHFTLISMSSAIEPLRMANRICGKPVYRWRTLSETGAAVTASDGVSINVDAGIENDDALRGLDARAISASAEPIPAPTCLPLRVSWTATAAAFTGKIWAHSQTCFRTFT